MAQRALFVTVMLISQVAFAAEFTSTDINTGIPGSTVSFGTDDFDITASGHDVWGTIDGLRFHYQQVSGDFDIRARLESVQNVNAWSKAGVAIRQSLASNCVHAMTVATAGNGFAFQYRSVEGGSSSHVAGGGTFYPFSWVRLVRIGQTVRSYKSVDPTADEWDFIGSTTLVTTDPVYVGLIVTSHNNAALCKAEFRNVDLHAYIPPVNGTGDGLSAQYFNSRNLSGAAVLSRIDSQVDFNWTTVSPDAAINADNFSVRWSGQVQAQFSEEYTFYTVSDDGVRLWLDGNLIVDHWTDHSRTENRTYPIPLVAGQKYNLVMEFYENGGNSEARLLWASRSTLKEAIPQFQLYSNAIPPVVGAGSGLKGEYCAGREFGTKVLTRVDSTIDFSWETGAPSPVVGSNDFAVRWTGLVEPKFTGQYTFYTVSDDGVRLWLDNQLVINNWTDHGSTENSGTIALSAGKKYPVRMEFYENSGNAVAKLLWSSVDQAKEVIPSSQLYPGQGTGLFAEYYDNDDLTNLKFTRVDALIDFDWATGSPAASIEADTFSVRWAGKVEPLYSEAYTFYTVSNDGVRLWVNDQLVIDNWADHATVEDTSAPITLSAGISVKIKMEFKDSIGDAVAKLLWSSASQTKQVVSSTQLQPNGGILVDIPVASAVSPAFIEGTCWSPSGQPFTINGTGTPVTMLADKRFFTNLPLDASAATGISFTHTDTGVSQVGSVIWTPTDIRSKDFSMNELKIRKGDSLLLTVSGTSGSLSIDANGDDTPDYTGTVGDTVPFQYALPGIFIVSAMVDNNSIGSILVMVVDANLSAPIACELGFQRQKIVAIHPISAGPNVIFESNAQEMSVSTKEISTTNTILLLKPLFSESILIARLSNNGPIISFRRLDVFTRRTSTKNYLFLDQLGIGKGRLFMYPKIPDLTVNFNMFASTSTFQGGSTSFSVNTSDFSGVIDRDLPCGKFEFEIEMPDEETKYCFSYTFFQDGQIISKP